MSRAIALFSAFMVFLGCARSQALQLTNAFPGLSFTTPLFLTHSGDGTDRIFVVQQNGVIDVFPNDTLVSGSKTFLDIGSLLSSTSGEEGLLGLAFHPGYASNGYFYVNYTAPNPLHTVISRFKVSASDPNIADPTSEYKILEFNQPYTNHNGGMLAFGIDGYLYIGVGDGGSAGDPQNNAQNLSVLLGKILRIDVNDTTATTHYRIPPDNPWAGNSSGYREEVWAFGLRNPFRFSIDPATGQLWAGDVGQDTREEVDLIQKGKNYGWRIMEGTFCYNPPSGCDTTGLTMPVKDYGRTLGNCVIGGYVYRGSRRPELQGAYIYGDFGSGSVFMFRSGGSSLTADSTLMQTPYNISSFGTDQDGELYVVSYSTGGIFRFNQSTITSAEGERSAVPANFFLDYSYPNPFNPTTNVRFGVPVLANVVFRLYDVLGRQVKVLAEGELSPGVHNVVLSSEGLSSGVFLLRMEGNSLDGSQRFSAVQRLVVLK